MKGVLLAKVNKSSSSLTGLSNPNPVASLSASRSRFPRPFSWSPSPCQRECSYHGRRVYDGFDPDSLQPSTSSQYQPPSWSPFVVRKGCNSFLVRSSDAHSYIDASSVVPIVLEMSSLKLRLQTFWRWLCGYGTSVAWFLHLVKAVLWIVSFFLCHWLSHCTSWPSLNWL